MTETRGRVEDVPGITKNDQVETWDGRREGGEGILLGEREEEEKKWKDRDRIQVARAG
jgi:hypothetical protein